MAHYAFLDENNIVTEVIVGKNEGEDGIDWQSQYSAIRGQVCKRTSYNTHGGVHSGGGTPFRKNYAGLGYMLMPSVMRLSPHAHTLLGYWMSRPACGMHQ
jgi:hypothetical protein